MSNQPLSDRASHIRSVVANIVSPDSPLFVACCEHIAAGIDAASLEAAASEEALRLRKLGITDVVAALSKVAKPSSRKSKAKVTPPAPEGESTGTTNPPPLPQ